jgi:uncharacterized LabA/DUF88 family protein
MVLARTLRDSGFDPVLFRRRGDREKGVDIALTKEMLVNAFARNAEVSVLIAGDEDYVGLVNEVKRYGQIVWGGFFENGMAPRLRLALDSFEDLTMMRYAGSDDVLAGLKRIASTLESTK